MKRIDTTTVATSCILTATAAVAFLLPDELAVPASVAAPSGPAALDLGGIVRDFPATHADFEVVPDLGYGHYAGNVAAAPSAEGRPVFTGADAVTGAPPQVRVADTLTIIAGASIASGGAGTVVSTNSTAAGAISIEGGCSIMNDVLVGPGGDPAVAIDNSGTISGSLGTLGSAFPMTPVVAPDDTVVGPNLGDAQYNGGTTVIDSNRHFQSLRVNTNGVVEIVGNVVIVCEGNLTVETGGSIVVMPGNSLNLYVKGQVAIKTKSQWSDPSSTRLHVVGAPTFKVETEAEFYGSIYAPQADVLVQTKSVVTGSVICNSLLMKTDSVIMPAGAGHPALVEGYKVLAPWTDATGREIAPHMQDVGAPPPAGVAHLAVNGKFTTKDPGSLIDGYDSTAGPYGGGNAGMDIVVSSNGTGSNIINLSDTTITGDVLAGPGADPGDAIALDLCTISGSLGTLTEAVAMPAIVEPALGPSVGDVTYNGGTYILAADLHGDKIFLDGGAVLQIDGDVTILCESEFKTTANSQIVLLDDSTLTLYTKGNLKFENGSISNANTADPGRFLCYHMSTNAADIDGGSVVYARIEAPNGQMMLAGGSEFWGTFVGAELTVQGPSWFHFDLGVSAPPVDCAGVSDTAGAAGSVSWGGISGPDTFDEWYRDVAGTNLSGFHRILLTDDGTGVYEYLDDAFHPIDGRLLGNEGYGHNHHFTYQINAEFIYADCGGQFLEFEGNDDLWVFIDDQLVVDLGGIGPARTQVIELDRMDLVDGEEYTLKLFHAQRRSASSVFRLRTNIELMQSGIPASSDAYD